MSHFAKIKDNIVINVIVADRSFIDSGAVGDPNDWIQTSYNTLGDKYSKQGNSPTQNTADKNAGTSSDKLARTRKNYAGVGYTYDKDLDAFIPLKPYDSWTLNKDTCLWESPVSKPSDGQRYQWNEEKQQWEVIKVGIN